MKHSSLKQALSLCLVLLILATLPPALAMGNGSPPSTIPDSSTKFKYVSSPENALTLASESVVLSSSVSSTRSTVLSAKGVGGNKLGNAPKALYRVLQKFLARGAPPPPHFPVPYVIYTLSDGGVEKFTDALTKAPIMINVDDKSGTGQGGKDIQVKTTIEVNPLRITSVVTRLGTSNPSYLKILITFPAFFYTGESGAVDGDPYWQFGYETQPSYRIPKDITMKFSVDVSIGSIHTFGFDWSSTAGIPKLGFTFGTFQVSGGITTTPIKPAFSNFVVSSPPSASLTFGTTETDTLTRKCMNWAAPSSFFLQFSYGESEEISGTPIEYDMVVTADKVPQTFSVCTTEDRAAGTYSVDYTASSTVHLLQIATEIFIGGTSTVAINLEIDDMPTEIHAVLSNGSLTVNVSENVGSLRLEVTADAGLADINSLVNLRLILVDIPDFTTTWSFVGFTLDAASCLGKIEFAFSNGALTFPTEHGSKPDSNYLFAYSIPGMTALAFRLHKVCHLSFAQDNSNGSNDLELGVCDRRVMYVIAHTEVGSPLTPEHNADLRIVFDNIPTELSVSWTIPFTLNLETNDPIASIVADLSLEKPSGNLDLTAHAEISSIPANMAWSINPGGSITLTADASIGGLELTISDPNGLVNAGTFFAGNAIHLLGLTMQNIPSFVATWSAETTTPRTSVTFNTAAGRALGDLEFGISTSETTFVTLVQAGVENRAIFYNDDAEDLGSGPVMEASLWVHAEDTCSVELEWKGSSPTVHIGFTTTESNELKVAMILDGSSALNPAAPKPLTGMVQTSALPTNIDLTVTPTSLDYTASGEIQLVTLDTTIGEPPSADIDDIHSEIEGIPSAATVSWSTGSFSASLSDRLDRVLVTIDNANGIFGSDLKHVEIEVLDIPASASATWDMNNKVATLSFLGGTYSEGLGQLRFLATTGDETPTTNYINSLGLALPSMTDYSTFTRDIDSGYWPATVSRFDSLYRRQPTLDTGADDYFVYRMGGGFDVYAGKTREIGALSVDLKNPGFANLEFSRNVVLTRPFYLMMDDLDSDWMTLAEVSQLPDGLSTNSMHAEWNSAGGHYGYTLSESIPFLDVYDGQHDSTSLTSRYMKLLFQGVPSSVSIDYSFGARNGYFDFVASSMWQLGYLSQDGSDRYVGWLQMQSVHFDYSFALPGEEPADFSGYDWSWGYRIFRLDSTLQAIGAHANGVLGIYNLESGLENLLSGTPPRTSEYIPQWTFILDDFDIFDIHILWDVGIGIDFGSISIDWDEFTVDIDAPSVDVKVLPSISIVADFNLIADFWWNNQIAETLGPIGIPTPVISFDFSASFTINDVKDYRDQNPIHLWGPVTASPVIFSWDWGSSVSWEWLPPSVNIDISVGLTIDVPGFHRMGDHPTPF